MLNRLSFRWSRPLLNRTGLFIAVLLLSACATKSPAPVVDRRPPPASAAPAATPTTPKPAPVEVKAEDGGKTHTVQRGDTLIGIALQYGLDYRELAMWNNIENPNVIRVDDVLRVTPPGMPDTTAAKEPKPGAPVATPLITTPVPSASSERPATNTATSKAEPKAGKVPYTDQALQRMTAQATPSPNGAAAPSTPPTPAVVPSAGGPTTAAAAVPAGSVVSPPAPVATSDDVEWAWPVKGKILANFTDANKGVDIAGTKGAPINAAAPGKVVYSGSGLRGYGRLVIIKHNATWLSAYAHNDKIIVAEGQEVKRGQKIAEMGNSDADQVKLHFEIRKVGKPVDPTKLLPAQ
jgi:lipoprotein NlpD